MLQGKVKAVLQVLGMQGKSGVLLLKRTVPSSGALPEPQQTVRDILIQKHPPGQPAHPETLLQCSLVQKPYPVLFEQLDEERIQMAALKSQGGAGPSGLDLQGQRRLCASFRKASSDFVQLCSTVDQAYLHYYSGPFGTRTSHSLQASCIGQVPRSMPSGYWGDYPPHNSKGNPPLAQKSKKRQDLLSCVLARSLAGRLQFMLCSRYLMTKTLKRSYK